MANLSPDEVTQLLQDCSNGDQVAFDKLFPLVYEELHRLAASYMSRERSDHTLQTTALVHEAYLRLVNQQGAGWQSRTHFFAVAAKVMRHLLVDYAKTRTRAKRGGGDVKLPLEEAVILSDERAADLLALDDALKGLAVIDHRKSRVVEMRFFGGLSNEEIAEVLNVSPNTVIRDWSVAKAWLHREVGERV
jgi:RNA polymerase sigma factor (TIGR02999 family)